jgi:hypothetical protein
MTKKALDSLLLVPILLDVLRANRYLFLAWNWFHVIHGADASMLFAACSFIIPWRFGHGNQEEETYGA